MEVTMKIEKITPETARKYLTQNIGNYRKLSMSKVKQYAEDMKNGRWELNGESIVFDENGVLKNGQHRLAGIVKAGVTVETAVTRGVKSDVVVFDTGYVRSALQIGQAKGIELSKTLVSAVNLIFYLLNGKNASKMEVIDYAEKHEDELNRAWRCMLNGQHTKKVMRSSLVVACYMMLTTQKMPFYELEVFFKAFSTNDTFGTDGYDVSSALVVRKMFDERWSGGCNQRSQREQLDVTIQAMNDLHSNRKRVNNYKITSPFAYEPLLKEIAKGV